MQYDLNTPEGIRETLDKYKFERPKKIKIPDRGIVASSTFTYEKKMPPDNVLAQVPVRVILLPDASNTDENGIMTATYENLRTDQGKESVMQFIDLKGLCSNAAESILTNLRHLFHARKNVRVFEMTFTEALEAYAEYLIENPKGNRNKVIFPDDDSVNRFKALFQKFINDRNLYTHGQVGYVSNNKSMAIVNFHPLDKKVRYYSVQSGHFGHYFFVYQLILKTMKLANSNDKA